MPGRSEPHACLCLCVCLITLCECWGRHYQTGSHSRPRRHEGTQSKAEAGQWATLTCWLHCGGQGGKGWKLQWSPGRWSEKIYFGDKEHGLVKKQMRKIFFNVHLAFFFFNNQVTKEQRNVVGLALRILDEVGCCGRNLANELSAPLRWHFQGKPDIFCFFFFKTALLR